VIEWLHICSNDSVSSTPEYLDTLLDQVDQRLAAGLTAAPQVWPTGFALLDTYLGGGLRAGELCLLGGAQGLGKTTLSLQIARNVAARGGVALVFSFEHDPATLLQRIVTIESGESHGLDGVPIRALREAMQAVRGEPGGLADRLASRPAALSAVAAVREYGRRLALHRCRGGSTDLDALRRAVDQVRADAGCPPLIVVDYLQKVHVPQGGPESERVSAVVEGLKDLALDLAAPVLAVVAADQEGLGSNRLRIHHLRGSSALAYEADVVLLINDKFDVVARHHLVFDPNAAERFHSSVVLTIAKNRGGLDHVDLQLRKNFEQSRFEPEAQQVREQLLDGRIFTE
jgi:replicative DNA helicase